MKKQLFSLMMAFALVLGLSVTAFAQYGVGTVDDPVTHVTGSTHTYTVTTDGGGTYAWTVRRTDDSDPTTDYTVVGAANLASFTFTWNDVAAGDYYVQVVDEGDGCTTTRRFYVSVFTFDVLVYASDDGGTILTDFSGCGDNNSQDPEYIFDNDPTTDENAIRADAANGALGAVQGTVGSTRYISFEVKFDDDIDTDPVYASVGFNYTVTATYTGGSGDATPDLQSFNSSASATGYSFINGTGPIFTVPIIWDDRWGSANDITFNVAAEDFTLYRLEGGSSASGQVILGEERPEKEGAQGDRINPDGQDANTSEDVTIEAAPATSVISAD